MDGERIESEREMGGVYMFVCKRRRISKRENHWGSLP